MLKVITSSDVNAKPFQEWPEILNINDVSELLGVQPQQARRLCAMGELPALHIGRRWYVSKFKLMEKIGVA